MDLEKPARQEWQVSPKEFINKAAAACVSEQLATVQHEDLRVHWELIQRKYFWAHEAQWASLMEKVRLLILEIEMHCPCGARPESPKTHPHVWGCPVAKALLLVNKENNDQKGQPTLDPYAIPEPPAK